MATPVSMTGPATGLEPEGGFMVLVKKMFLEEDEQDSIEPREGYKNEPSCFASGGGARTAAPEMSSN